MDVSREYEATEQDISVLREWMAKKPYLVQDLDDYELRVAIKASKGRLEKAKFLLENGNALPCRYPKLLSHLDPLDKTFQDFLNSNFAFPMPTKTENGSTVCLLAPRSDVDLPNYRWEDVIRLGLMGIGLMVWEKTEGNCGLILIHDCSNANLGTYKNLTPAIIRDALRILEVSSVHLKAVHIIKMPSFAEPIISIAKPLMKDKIFQRVHFHSRLETVHEMVPKECLPKEYGGYGESVRILHDSWKNKLESYRDKFMEKFDKARKLDPLRPKSQGPAQELDGTFRQLLID